MSKTTSSACEWLAACVEVLAACTPDLCGPPIKSKLELNYGTTRYQLTVVLSRPALAGKAEALRLRGRTLAEGTVYPRPYERAAYLAWSGSPRKRAPFADSVARQFAEDKTLTTEEAQQNAVNYRGLFDADAT